MVSDCIYEPDCEFADPTVKFRGVQRYKKNLQASHQSIACAASWVCRGISLNVKLPGMQLLVPFLESPELRLTSLRCIKTDKQRPTLIKVLSSVKQQSIWLAS